MNEYRLPRIMLAAPASGSGKTTVTCALLQVLKNRALRPVAFKCGPDYIDPLFHREIIGIPSRNLDLFFQTAHTVRNSLRKNTSGADLAVIEGVMGYYDGLAGQGTTASSYDLARQTATPVILVINCRGMSVSIVAQIKGYLTYRQDSRIVGVILNQLSATLYSEIKVLIEEELALEVLGYLPKLAECRLKSRHLGLVTASEVADLQQKIQILAEQLEKTVNIERLLALAEAAEPLHCQETQPLAATPKVRIALAQDQAFCFYYQDNLEVLTELGAELVTFSPLQDRKLPENIAGLLLGGGYPELYAAQLSENQTLLQEIKERLDGGLPCIAECGGFIYLHQALADQEGQVFPLVGALQGSCFPTERLQRFGYVTLTAQTDNLLAQAGASIKAHEFHYWDCENPGAGFRADKAGRQLVWDCVQTSSTLYAGFPHLHFDANQGFAVRFMKKAGEYAREQGENYAVE